MQKIKNILLLVITGLLILPGCMKKESFSDIPAIQFKDFVMYYDTLGRPDHGELTISFQDGNGDIGLSGSDTYPPFDSLSPYYYNFIIDYYEMRGGVFKKVNLAFPLSARIPVLNPDNNGKPIKGTLVDKSVFLNPNPVYDTVKYEVYIYDRALNKSNVISTPTLILRKI